MTDDYSGSPPKRTRASPTITLECPDDVRLMEDEIGDELIIAFAIDVNFMLLELQPRSFWQGLRVLQITPSFNDHDIPAVLNLSHPQLYFPSLETLIIKNHAVTAIRLSQVSAPRLRSIMISHPLGVAIDAFELNLPQTLEEVGLEYLVIRDGYGFTRSLDKRTNPNLERIHKFATTVYLSGIV